MLASRLLDTLEKGIWINGIQDRLDHQGKQYAIARAQIADLCRRYETEERLCTFRNEFESCKSLEIDRWLKPLTSINVACIYIYYMYIHVYIHTYIYINPNYTSRIIIHWSNNIVNFFERLTREPNNGSAISRLGVCLNFKREIIETARQRCRSIRGGAPCY